MKIDIRELSIKDIQFILNLENDTNIWKVSGTTEKFTESEIEQFIINNEIEGFSSGQKRWVITANEEVVGCIDLFDYSALNKRAGVGIVVDSKFQNKGIAKKALAKFKKMCKNELKLNQLYSTVLEENTFSIKLFTKQGFTETGIRKQWTYFNNKFHDEIFYQSIL